MPAHMVIAMYRPKPGREAALAKLVAAHHRQLLEWGFATKRKPLVLRSVKDGTILEIFEWKSAKAVEKAHSDPRIHEMWGRYDAVCRYVSLGDLAEAKGPFPHFEIVSPKRA